MELQNNHMLRILVHSLLREKWGSGSVSTGWDQIAQNPPNIFLSALLAESYSIEDQVSYA